MPCVYKNMEQNCSLRLSIAAAQKLIQFRNVMFLSIVNIIHWSERFKARTRISFAQTDSCQHGQHQTLASEIQRRASASKLTSWGKVLFEKLIVTQVFKRFSTFYRNLKQIIVFIRSRLGTTWTLLYSLFKIQFDIILSSAPRSSE